MRTLAIAAAVLAMSVAACHERKRDLTPRVAENQEEILPRVVLPDQSLDPTDSLSTIEPELEDHLFGKFFNDRAEFYVVQYPTNTLFDKPVDEITLCFLDGKLSQTRYMLHDDLTDELISKYGKFTFKPFDPANSKLLEDNRLIDVGNGQTKLNSVFTNYELSWDTNDKRILVRVDRTKPAARVTYTERLHNHTATYKMIELASY